MSRNGRGGDPGECAPCRDTFGDNCASCNEYVDQDELLAHAGLCCKCNPGKIKNMDRAFKEAGLEFYKHQAEELLKIIIKEDQPDSVEDLHNSFWLRLANDRNFKHRSKDFQEPLRLATKKLLDNGTFQDKNPNERAS